MKTKRLIHTFFALFVLGLLISSFAAKTSRIEEDTFPFERTYAIKGQSKESAMSKMQEWMQRKYGADHLIISNNQLVGYGSFYVISRNFLGKTTKTCYYTLSVQAKGDSLLAIVEDVYLSWYQAPQYKGSRGGTQFKALTDILPLERKVPLEKKTYRQYLDQMEEHFEKAFEHTERLSTDTVAKEMGSETLVPF